MPFDFIGFFGPSRDEYRGRSCSGPAFGHPDDCPEEYGVPKRSNSWWERRKGPQFNRQEEYSGPALREEDWRGPSMGRYNDSQSCENMRPEGWRGPQWWCWRDRSNVETDYSKPEGWQIPPWMRNRETGNFYSETGEYPEWRSPPWMWNRSNAPYGGDCDRPRHEGWQLPPKMWNRDGPECWRGHPHMWNRDGPGDFTAETGERSRSEKWRGTPRWPFTRGDLPQ